MKLIWHAENLLERDWLREIFGSVIDEEIVDLDQTFHGDDALHIVSSNYRPLNDYEDYFRTCRERCKRIFLLHLSDEWFSGKYKLYRHFDLVIRNFHTYLAEGPGILTIPEGYSNGTNADRRTKPSDERQYVWSFVGELKASRIEMAQAMSPLGPHLLTPTSSISDPRGKKLSKPDFDAILLDSVFCPCPMGNVILETWRFYEGLELGCIPLAESRLTLDYVTELMGPNPIPTFRSWHDARTYAEKLVGDKQALLAKQREISSWWSTKKLAVHAQVAAQLTGKSHAGSLVRYANAARNQYPMLYAPLRLAELLRHQSGASLVRRLSNPTGPLRRIISEASAPSTSRSVAE